MNKYFGCVALGIMALFLAAPAPAVAGSFGVGGIGGIGRIGGFGGIGRIGSIGGLNGYIGRPGALIFDRPGWSRPVYRDWPEDYYYPNVEPSYYYPYAAYRPMEQAVEVNAALIRLSVPNDARIWIEGDATSQTGTERTFVSPALTPGREYVYHIRVQWDENGKAAERKRDVTVHAGDRINVNIDK
jgi:uncharacterized protein (TIGR03000 family)